MKFLVIQKGEFILQEILIYLKTKGLVEETNSIEKLSDFSFNIVLISPNKFLEEDFFNILKFLIQKNLSIFVFSESLNKNFICKCYEIGCHHYLDPKVSLEFFENLIGKEKLRNFLAKKIKTHDLDFWSQIEFLDNLGISKRPLLITGPSGVGKTKVAKLIHEYHFGKKGKFIEVNCSEISENLIESELFGYKKGAFTGAFSDKKGLISMADNGTLFLDEVATMPVNVQKKLLKVIDEKSYLPVGGEKREFSNFFLISATCENLESLMELGKFRSDLFYRIEGFTLNIKGLGERKGDIEMLIEYFLKDSPRKMVISEVALNRLISYEWPGNIRELLNFVECLRMVKGGIITEEFIERKLSNKEKKKISLTQDPKVLQDIKERGLIEVIEGIEEDILNYFYNFNGGRVRKTTLDLKISNNTFYRIKKRISV